MVTAFAVSAALASWSLLWPQGRDAVCEITAAQWQYLIPALIGSGYQCRRPRIGGYENGIENNCANTLETRIHGGFDGMAMVK